MEEYSILVDNKKVPVYIQFKRVKNINIRVNDGSIRISAPYKTSKEYIFSLLTKKEEWLKAALKKTEEREGLNDIFKGIWLFGIKYPVVIKKYHTDEYVWQNDSLVIKTKSPENRQAVNNIAQMWYASMAEEIFISSLNRVYPLVKSYGIPKPQIVYTFMKSRWGVCFYTKGKIKMNINLLKYPPQCIDQVMLHELVHFLVHNHGKEFYAYMDKIMPDWKKWDNILKGKV